MGERIILELTSADLAGSLQAISRANIEIREVLQTGELSIRFTVRKDSFETLSHLLERRGDRVRVLRRLGASRGIWKCFHRPVLLVTIAVLLCLTVWIPTRVFFVRVEGNQTLPTNLILLKAEESGISFGADRSKVRSERIKNTLLEALPQLQWAGVNTTGCVATITVRERNPEPERDSMSAGSIVALRDGIIRSCTVHQGTALCAPGQAVRAGEVLISGFTDCGLSILATRADGEVFAETSRVLSARTPETVAFRTAMDNESKKISLLIGKKRINFYKDSGILDASCVKMYSEYYLTLPGGFPLPFGIGIETRVPYHCSEAETVGMDGILERYSRQYLLDHMTAGQILRDSVSVDGNRLFGKYICLEMIGQMRYEEITKEHGNDNGKNG